MRLLIVEDKDSFRRLLLKAMENSAWEVHAAATPTEALEILKNTTVEAMVTDLRLPGMSGLELLKRARRFNPSMRVMLMSAFGEPRDIVEAMQSGADDFIPKPFDLDVFYGRLEKLRALHASPPPDHREPWVVASKTMQNLETALRTLAETSEPVIFVGQTGTGRSRAARRLHLLRHPSAPYHSRFAHDIQPGSLSKTLLRDHTGGSLLLKDLEHLPSKTLPELLDAIEAHHDMCWMGTCSDTNSLPEPLRSGMGVFCLTVAPLEERKDDVLPLFRSHMLETCNRGGRIPPLIDLAVEKELMRRNWQGNVAELVWTVQEALRACSGALLNELPPGPRAPGHSVILPRPPKGKLSKMLQDISKDAEKHFLEEALKQSNGDPSVAAESLELAAKVFIHKLKEHRITLD